MKKRGLSKIRVSSIIYDENLDILELFTTSKTEYCINIGDLLIVHLDHKKNIVGLEILGVSEVQGIPKAVLNNLKSASILINQKLQEKEVFIGVQMISNLPTCQIATLTSPPISCEQLAVCKM